MKADPAPQRIRAMTRVCISTSRPRESGGPYRRAAVRVAAFAGTTAPGLGLVTALLADEQLRAHQVAASIKDYSDLDSTQSTDTLFVDDVFLVGSDRLVVPVNYTAWRVAHLVIGLVFVVVGYAIITGRAWSRGAGIVLGLVSAVLNLLFITAYPAWSLLVIAFDVVTIYALAVHGQTAIRYITTGSVGNTGTRS